MERGGTGELEAMREEISISFPAGEDGMIPRQCPNCRGKFKIHQEQYGEGGYLNLRCPYCKMIYEKDEFITEEQEKYAEAVAENKLRKMSGDALSGALEDVFSSSDSLEVESDPNIDFGSVETPSPHLSMDLERGSCNSCGFEYAVSVESGPVCPVCR